MGLMQFTQTETSLFMYRLFCLFVNSRASKCVDLATLKADTQVLSGILCGAQKSLRYAPGDRPIFSHQGDSGIPD